MARDMKQKLILQRDDELDALVDELETRWSNGERKLRAFQREGEIRAICTACGLERVEQIRHLVERCGRGDWTLSDVSDAATCLRSSCGEPLVFEAADT